VEILVVVVIISIIVTGIIVVAASVLKKAKVNATKGIIQNLVSALQEYKIYDEADFNNNNDKYISTKSWIESLYAVPNCKKILNNIPDDHRKDTNSNQIVDTVIDSWGREIRIESYGAGTFPTIRSRGPDDTFKTADDIISDTITM